MYKPRILIIINLFDLKLYATYLQVFQHHRLISTQRPHILQAQTQMPLKTLPAQHRYRI